MHEHDALIASKTKLAFRYGKIEGEYFYYDGIDFRREFRGKMEKADRYQCLGLRDWIPYDSDEYVSPFVKKPRKKKSL